MNASNYEPVNEPPAPWKRLKEYPIGGIRQVGFAAGSDLLLAVTLDGAGLFNCATGERIAREKSYSLTFLEEVRLRATGIGPIMGQEVRMAGLHGGGLRLMTEDHWRLEANAPHWPSHNVYLVSPSGPGMSRNSGRINVANDDLCPLIAYGFSETGRSFIVALSCTLIMFAR